MLRIGLLGASRIAPRAVITPARGRDDVEVSAVAARDVDRARAYAAHHAIPHTASSYQELLAHGDVDLIYCALPPSEHRDICLQALAAGKALLVEKPFAMNAVHAAQIAAAAVQADRPALEAFHYRFHSLFLQAMESVRTGAIGRLRHARGMFNAEIGTGPGELRWIPDRGGGGAMDLGCYVVHALRTLAAEEPRVISAEAQLRHGVDADMRSVLEFPSGLRSVVESSMVQPHQAFLHLQGDAGELRLENFVSPHNGGRLLVRTAAGEQERVAEGPASYDAQLAHVVQVMNAQAQAVTGGDDAVANMRVLDDMRARAGVATA